MKAKNILIISLFAICVASNANAVEVRENGLGEKVFSMFSKYAKNSLDMDITIPSGYSVAKYCTDAFWQPILSESGGDGYAKTEETSTECLPQSYGYLLMANDGESAIVIPRLGDIAMGEVKHHNKADIYMELLAHYNDCMGTKHKLNDATMPLIKQMLISDNSLSKAFNADSALIATIPMKVPFMGKYTQCIGIYLLKNGHTKTYIKLLLTDKSRSDERAIINHIAQSVKFGNKKEILNMLDNRSNWWKFTADVAALEKESNK